MRSRPQYSRASNSWRSESGNFAVASHQIARGSLPAIAQHQSVGRGDRQADENTGHAGPTSAFNLTSRRPPATSTARARLVFQVAMTAILRVLKLACGDAGRLGPPAAKVLNSQAAWSMPPTLPSRRVSACSAAGRVVVLDLDWQEFPVCNWSRSAARRPCW